MASRRKSDVEWIAGIVPMPGRVVEGGIEIELATLLWLGHGFILGAEIGTHDALIKRAADILRATIAQPLAGPAHRPARIRVSDPSLALAIRGSVRGVEVEEGETPEVDDVFRHMRQNMPARKTRAYDSVLDADISVDEARAVFAAAAELYRAKPWRHIRGDERGISATIESQALREAVVSVIGQQGTSHGFIVFETPEDADAYGAAADAYDRGERVPLPPHYSLSYARGAEVQPEHRKSIAVNGLEVAAADAYPAVMAVVPPRQLRPMHRREAAITEALSRALAVFLHEPDAAPAALGAGAPFTKTLTVPTFAGELSVTLRVPYRVKAPARGRRKAR